MPFKDTIFEVGTRSVARGGSRYSAPMAERSIANLQPIPHGQIRSVLGHVAMLGLGGVLLGGAFPEPGWWPFIWVALVPIGILAARTASLWRLAWTSYVVFLVWWLVRVAWLIPVTPGGWFGAAAALAVYAAAAVVAMHILTRRLPLPMTVALPMAWVGAEFVRAQFPLGGFGWFQLAHALAPYAPDQGVSRFAQTADIFGEWTVSLVIAMTSGLLVDLLVQPWYRPYDKGGPRWQPRLRRTMRGVLVFWAVLFSAAWWYGQFQVGVWEDSVDGSIAVAVVQTHVPQDNKNHPTPEDERRRWRDLVSLTQRAASLTPRPALVVWPETMAPAALNPEAVADYRAVAESWRGVTWEDARRWGDEEALAATAEAWGVAVEDLPAALTRRYEEKAAVAGEVLALAQELDIAILAGAPAEALPENGRGNSAFLVDPVEGYATRRYDKVHIVPFGEYIPIIREVPFLKRLFLDYLSPYGFDYSLTPGDAFFTFELAVPTGEGPGTRAVRVGTPICFEDAVASVCRAMIYEPDDPRTPGRAKPGDVLVNLTNDGWFTGSAQPWQHLQLATFRSIENRVPTARAVNTGVSGFIDSVGRVKAILPAGVADVAVDELRLDRRRSLFGLVGRWPMGLLTLATGGLLVAGFFRRDRQAADQ